MAGTRFPSKPALWTPNPAFVRPEYLFQWRNAVLLLPMLEPWPRLPGGISTNNDDITFDFSTRTHWRTEDELVFPDRDELGFSVRIDNDARNLLSSPDTDNEVPENTPLTIALMVKPTATATGIAQLIRDGNNFLIFADRSSSPGSGEYGTWVRLSGSDIWDEETGDQNIVFKEQWNSIVFTWDGTIARCFINGSFAVSGAASSVGHWDFNFIGEGLSGQGYVGNIGYFAVHKNAWSSEDVVLFHQDPWGGFRMASDVPHIVTAEEPIVVQPNARNARIVAVIST